MADEHLRSDDYVSLDATGTAANLLARRTLRHLIDACPVCREEWDRLGPRLQETLLDDLHRFTAPQAPPEPSDDDLRVDTATLDAQDELMDQLRYHRRRAYEQLWILQRLPPHRRAAKIKGAFRQFQGRAFAELLVETSRSLVRKAPAEALGWAELVPLALDWAKGDAAPDWAPGLLARAEAHRANALRILGDHPAADRIFVELRRTLGAHPVGDPAVVAEVTSLEASLRIEQNHLPHAEELLDRAALAYQYAGDGAGLARARIKHAMLVRGLGRPGDCLPLLDAAAESLASAPQPVDPYLRMSIVSERLNALCDLERYREARRLLDRNLDVYEDGDDLFGGAILRCLEGRIALGWQDYTAAEAAFEDCREGLLVLGRSHDAALASLFLAEVYLRMGRAEDLRQLAGPLVARFRASQLPAETLHALELFEHAVAAHRLTVAVVVELRRRLSLPGTAPTSTSE